MKSLIIGLSLLTTLTVQAQAPLATPSTQQVDLRLAKSGKNLSNAGQFMMGAALGTVVGIAVPWLIQKNAQDSGDPLSITYQEELNKAQKASRIAAYTGAGISLISLIGAGINLIEAGNKLTDAYVSTADGNVITASPPSAEGEFRKMSYSEMESAWGKQVATSIRNEYAWKGMTTEQALQSRGKPESISKMEGNMEVWTYGRGRLYKRLTFVNGKLTEKE